jgi:hypothetical protein
VESGLVSESLLQLALSVQTYVASGKLRKSLSGQVLEIVAREGISVETAVERIQPDKQQISNNLPLYQFLQLAGVIGPKDIEDALKAGSRNAQLMGQMLLLTGAIDQNLLQIALKCSELMAQGILKAEQAVIALGILLENKRAAWKTLSDNWAGVRRSLPQPSPRSPRALPA